MINMLLCLILALTIHGKKITQNLKYQLLRWMKKMNHLTNCILYQIFKIIYLSIPWRTRRKDGKSFIKNLCKQNRKYNYLEVLTPKTIKLLEGTKIQITKNKTDDNVPHLEITEVALSHSNIVKNNYKQASRVLIHLFLINRLINYKIFLLNILKCHFRIFIHWSMVYWLKF